MSTFGPRNGHTWQKDMIYDSPAEGFLARVLLNAVHTHNLGTP